MTFPKSFSVACCGLWKVTERWFIWDIFLPKFDWFNVWVFLTCLTEAYEFAAIIFILYVMGDNIYKKMDNYSYWLKKIFGVNTYFTVSIAFVVSIWRCPRLQRLLRQVIFQHSIFLLFHCCGKGIWCKGQPHETIILIWVQCDRVLDHITHIFYYSQQKQTCLS